MLFKDIFNKIFILTIGLILPIILIILVKIVGYSEIVEELAKTLIVLFLILKLSLYKDKIFYSIYFAILFGLSENIFYLKNIFELGNLNIFFMRFVWVIPMHIATMLILTLSGTVKRWFIIIGFILAIIVHILFNNIIVNIIVH